VSYYYVLSQLLGSWSVETGIYSMKQGKWMYVNIWTLYYDQRRWMYKDKKQKKGR